MKCNICGKETKSQRVLIYHVKNKHDISFEQYLIQTEHIVQNPCIYCGNPSSFDQKHNIYRKVCSNRICVGKYAKTISDKAVFEKYGVTNVFSLKSIINKSKQTKLDRYGSETYNNPEQNKQTCLEKYGVDNGSKTKEAREKISERYFLANNTKRREKLIITLHEKYGENVSWNSQDPSVCQKIKDTLKITRKEVILNRINEMDLSIIDDNFDVFKLRCNKCGNIYENVLRSRVNFSYLNDGKLCDVCFPKEFRSKGEESLLVEIKKLYDGEILTNKKMFKYEADIVIPDKHICFEYNGVYWHSELYKDKEYHKNKKIKFIKKGYNLIHIWEDEWNDELKKNIIIARIKSALGLNKKIYARKCVIKEISSKESREFLLKYHLHGNINASFRIGLFYNDELVSVSTFGKRSFGKSKKSYELLRNCSKEDITVVGGFSKMITYALKNLNYIHSFVDFDWTDMNNSSYTHSNFILKSHSSPGYFWVVNGKRENRLNFQKSILIKQGADPNKSEEEIMHEAGYYKIFNSGNLLYEIFLNNCDIT